MSADPAAVLSFTVPGVPQPQGSKRLLGRRLVESNDATLRPWRTSVTAHALAAPRDGVLLPFTGAVAVRVTFRFPRPGGHFGSGRNRGRLRGSAPARHRVRPDADKLVRAVCDALTDAGVWRDDAQVAELQAVKVYHDAPGAVIAVWEVEP